MARFYSSFDNSTVTALEAITGNNNFERLAMTNGATLKSNLLAARSALSAAVYADMAVVDQDGTRGVVMPTDGYSRGGGNLTWTDLYTNTAAVWPSNPRTRPTAGITTSAPSVIISPSVADGSITETLYTDAQTALQAVLSGIANSGPYNRLGLNPWRTLASLYHDHDMTYVAWDDFTPGQPGSVSPSSPGTQAAASDLIITINWSLQYAADRDNTAGLYLSLHDMGVQPPSGDYTTLSVDVDAGNLSYVWTIPGGTLPAGLYELDASVTFKDGTIPAHEGTPRTYGSGGVTPYIELT